MLVEWVQGMWGKVWVRQGAANWVGMWRRRFEKEGKGKEKKEGKERQEKEERKREEEIRERRKEEEMEERRKEKEMN